MSAVVPIRHLTLYKHGVAYVTRQGAFQGDRIALALRRTELDDALKSLAVFDRTSGAVVCVDYETPASDATTSGSASTLSGRTRMQLGAGSGLTDLLEALVGWDVRIDQGTGGHAPQGRVLGLQTSGATEHHSLLLCNEATGVVETIKLSAIAAIAPLDPRLGERVKRLLDDRRLPDGLQEVNIRLQPGEHDVALSYLVPSPSWRVCYRAFAESQEGSGIVRLQAWGVVDNLFGEDLDNVTLSLVAGQPISFQYELSKPVVPIRPNVVDQARFAVKPIDFETSAREFVAAGPMAAPPAYAVEECSFGPADRELAAAGATPATGADLGELFAYRVGVPVSIPMGTSALVPILDVTIDGKSELLFNERKHALNPIRAMRCENKTGSVLERGPVTVVENGEYVGEALLPFTTVDGALFLPYAVELGVIIKTSDQSSSETTGVRLGKGAVILEETRRKTVEYAVQNKSSKQHEVLLECARAELPGELQTGNASPEIVGEVYRWKVACPPNTALTFKASSVRVVARATHGEDVDLDWLKYWIAGPSLARSETGKKLIELMPIYEEAAACRQNLAEIISQHATLTEALEETRENLTALRDSEAEAALRKKLVAQMGSNIDVLRSLEVRRDALGKQAHELDAEAKRRLMAQLQGQ